MKSTWFNRVVLQHRAKVRLGLVWGVVFCWSVAANPVLVDAQFRTDKIAITGDLAPGGIGTFANFFHGPLLNDPGQTTFSALLAGTVGGPTDDFGIFRGSGALNTLIARQGQLSPGGNGTLNIFFGIEQNNSGQVFCTANLLGTSGGSLDDRGIFRGNGGALTQIVREGQTAPDGNGFLESFNDPAVNDSGQAVFLSIIAGTSGGSIDNSGIFRGNGGALTQIVREGQPAPDGNGVFNEFFDPAFNNSNQAAFVVDLRGTAGGTTDDFGIYRGSGGALTQIVREGQIAPDGNGNISGAVTDIKLNNIGQVAFEGLLSGTSGGANDNSGIFRGNGGVLTQIAREGQGARMAMELSRHLTCQS